MTELARMLEAILFVADEPISTVELAQVLDEPTDCRHGSSR